MIPGGGCAKCGTNHTLAPTNTIVYYFTVQPWFSFALLTCAPCEFQTRIFMRDRFRAYLEFLTGQQFKFVVESFAPPDVVKGYEALYELQQLGCVDLTPRLEEEISQLGAVLLSTPDEWLQEVFTDPAPAALLPERWT